jgi:hypothetical protein
MYTAEVPKPSLPNPRRRSEKMKRLRQRGKGRASLSEDDREDWYVLVVSQSDSSWT